MQKRTVVFSTERAVLTEMQKGDHLNLLDHLLAVPQTPSFTMFDESDALNILIEMMDEQVETPRSVYRLGIFDKGTSSFSGIASVRKLPEMDICPDIGISLNPDMQGMGLGTEILRGLIKFTFNTFAQDCIIQAKLNPSNEPSLRLHFKCGLQPFCFKKDGFQDGNYFEDDLSMRITRTHFESYGARPAFNF